MPEVFSRILDLRLSRRSLLQLTAALALPRLAIGAERTGPSLLGFTGIPHSSADTLSVPPGYRAQVIYAWGDPTGIAAGAPAFRPDGSGSAEEQALQAGMHHDGMEYFSLPGSRDRALLAMNHEYTAENLLHPDGEKTWSAAKMLKSQSAQGCSIVEVRRGAEGWQVVRPSSFARRITARTPMRLSGPAAGHELMRTAADPRGEEVIGTFANCAAGRTPWGTYLTCEENFHGYFIQRGAITADQRRYGIGNRSWVRWHETDERFEVQRHPNEPNRFGWVVEIDPYRPDSTPVKRTALGRIKHEGATTTLAADGRVVVYMGDDEPFERIYKFVSRGRYDRARPASARGLLDEGTLYVARFDADGSGRWLPLVAGQSGLSAANGFATQAEVCIRTRQATDVAGGTRMDRPEWITVHPATGEVYCTLTNNPARGSGQAPADAANPRPDNVLGHVIRWREAGRDAAAETFGWDVFVLAGDPAHKDPARRGTVRGDPFAGPDGLRFDSRGVLWIQTDASGGVIRSGDYRIGNNQMLAADPLTGETRRFLVGPPGCEMTGVTFAPDNRTVFVNVQHPGEGAPSTWPDHLPGGKPRSATVAIRRIDGGLIGT